MLQNLPSQQTSIIEIGTNELGIPGISAMRTFDCGNSPKILRIVRSERSIFAPVVNVSDHTRCPIHKT